MKLKLSGMPYSLKKEWECGIRTPPSPFQTFIFVIDHRKLQNLVRISVTHSHNSLCATPLFLLHFETFFLDYEQKQQLGIYLESDVHWCTFALDHTDLLAT